MAGNRFSDTDVDGLARRILESAEHVTSIPPLTSLYQGFGLAQAYRVASRIIAVRKMRGERPIGWKIGFTNRTIWDEYDVHEPIWGPIYDTTAIPCEAECRCALAALLEPRIEPEIVFRLGRLPHAGMDESELVVCVDAVGHGFEIVQSVYPGWRFRVADTVAAFALHGAYRYGPLAPVEPADRREWVARLSRFEIALYRNGSMIDRGFAENVLGGPLQALRHFVEGHAQHSLGLPLRAGDLVTTGTVTRAFPVEPGERWRTEVTGLPLGGLEIDFD